MIGLPQPEHGRVITGHPIARALVMAVNFAKVDAQVGSSVVTIIPEDTGVAGPGSYLNASVVYARGINRYGQWAGFGAAALGSQFIWSRSDFLPTSGGFTALMIHEKADGTNRASITWGLDTATEAQYCHAAMPYSDGVVYFAYGGNAAGSTRLDVSGLTFGADRWVFSKGARGMECWQNGILRGSNAANPSRTQSVTTDFTLGSKQAQVLFSDVSHFNMFAIWQRQLTKDEILMVSHDPYMLWDEVAVGPERAIRATLSAPLGGGHPVGKITQLMPYALPGQRYGSFAGRVGQATARRPNRLTTLGVT